jgi:hypothetical protein
MNGNKKKKYVCEKCGAVYETENALKNHVCEPPLPKNRMMGPTQGQQRFSLNPYFLG